MSGHHHHHHDHGDNLRIAFFLNLFFTIFEIGGGYYTNSIAVLSDAIHDFGDTLTLGAAWYLQHLSKKKKNDVFNYGYGRFSTLGAFITSTILFIGSIYIWSETIPRLFKPQAVHSQGMFIMAIVGIAINGFAAYRLSKGKSLNERSVYLHLLEDVLGWVAVLVGSVIIYFSGWTIIDPILSIGLSMYILYNVIKNFKGIAKVFLQAVPEGINHNEIKKELETIPDIHEIKKLNIWTIDGEHHVVTLHLIALNNHKIVYDEIMAMLISKDFTDINITILPE